MGHLPSGSDCLYLTAQLSSLGALRHPWALCGEAAVSHSVLDEAS